MTSATEVGNTRPSALTSESVARIHEVCFYSLTSSTWDEFPTMTDTSLDSDTLGPTSPRDIPFTDSVVSPPSLFVHPCMPLTKILSSGSFYYPLDPQWDISSRLAVRLSRDSAAGNDLATFDQRFVWNEYIIRSLLDFRERLDPKERGELDRCQFIVRSSIYSRNIYQICSLDLGHPRLRWCVHDGPASPPDRWLTNNCNSLIDLAAGMETRRNSI